VQNLFNEIKTGNLNRNSGQEHGTARQ